MNKENYICGNCNTQSVAQPGWVCGKCKRGPTAEPTKEDTPNLDIHMINIFSSCAKVIESLPKERQIRVAKALGILYGT